MLACSCVGEQRGVLCAVGGDDCAGFEVEEWRYDGQHGGGDRRLVGERERRAGTVQLRIARAIVVVVLSRHWQMRISNSAVSMPSSLRAYARRGRRTQVRDGVGMGALRVLAGFGCWVSAVGSRAPSSVQGLLTL